MSDAAQHPQQTWKTGDAVQWTHCTRRGSSIEMHTWEGKVERIRGDGAAVVKRRGKLYAVRPDRLRAVGAPNELSEIVHAMAEAHAAKGQQS